MMLLARSILLATVAGAVGGCTSTNPAFGDGSGDDGSGGESSSAATSLDGTASLGTSQSTTVSTTEDPTAGERCGDGDLDPGEFCDDGENNGDTERCQPDCTKNECGDGFTSPQQLCDDGPKGSDDCTPMCTLRSCGDGIPQGEEACDDKNEISTDDCVNCQQAGCGDTQVWAGVEECDDGNDNDEDACVACQDAQCSDGHIWAGMEECDDANMNQNDECTNLCLQAECGDGLLDESDNSQEQCDGNPAPSCADLGFDGGVAQCSGSCQVVGCTECGNGILEFPEVCDPKAPGSPLTCLQFGLGGSEDPACTSECVADLGPCCALPGELCDGDFECCFGCDGGMCGVG